MSQANHITQAQVEALFDNELPEDELFKIEDHMDRCSDCSSFLESYMETQNVLTLALQEEIHRPIEDINWHAFEHRISAQIAVTPFAETEHPIEKSRIDHEANSLSLFQQAFQWVRNHPGFLLASVATAGILFVLALPMLDPAPPKEKDVIVERITKAKTARVSVLTSKNKATGQSMTIIDVKAPPSDVDDDKDKLEKQNQPRTKRKRHK